MGCGPSEADHAGAGPTTYPYKITTTVGMITDIVRQVSGGHAVVEGIIGEGIDPHLYKPTNVDVKSLQGAEVVFYNGLMLEGKMGDVLVKVARGGKPVHAVTEEIQAEGRYVITDEAEHYDPHVWMDVAGWMRAVEVVEKALSGFDPVHKSDYAANAAEYRNKLEALDGYARKAIGSIPENNRVLVTAHDAFGYMARAYGVEVKAIQGISTESKAAVKDIEVLVDYLVEHKIPAIFVESSVPKKNVEALQEGAGARGHQVKIGGELFSDAMGPAGTYEGTYLGMIDHNVTTITRALGGAVPEGGFRSQGKAGAGSGPEQSPKAEKPGAEPGSAAESPKKEG